jgi:hypothetical protein
MARPVLIVGAGGFAREKAKAVRVVAMNDVSCEMTTSYAGNHVHPLPIGSMPVHQGCRAGSPRPRVAANVQENK